METYTLTADQVKLEVFQALIEEFKEVRKARNLSKDAGEIGADEVLDLIETTFANCFNKTKDNIENG